MAKKRRSSRGVSEAEDVASVASTSTLASMQDLTAADELEFVDPFERCLEALYEKRSSTRETALAGLIALMERSYSYEDCLFRKDTMKNQLMGCLRRGGLVEAGLAVRALGLHLLSLGLGPELDSMLPEVSLALQKTATASGKDAGLRSAALEVLALLTFAGQEDEAETHKVMSGLLVLAGQSGSPRISAAAMRGWSLLLSALPHHCLTGALCSGALEALTPHLQAKDVEERGAAGEAVALLFSVAELFKVERGESGDDLSDDNEDAEEEPNALDDIVSRMRDLASNRGDAQRRSKKDRAYLKSTFREHYKAVEGRQMTFDRVKMREGRTLVIDTLEGQVQLNAFRNFLGSGLQIQLESNSLLRDVFSLGGESIPIHLVRDEMAPPKSRTPSSAQQKSRSKSRSKQQAQKAFQAEAGAGEYF